ncbi:MAG: Ig-like domain-containing protein [Candidatus Desantisbacteria bacterium]
MLNKSLPHAMAILIISALICLSTTAHALEIRKQPAGNAGDNNPASFKFSGLNAEKQLTRRNGLPISRTEAPSLFNTDDGMRIYDNGIDVCSTEYTNVENKKKPVGIDLSDVAGWPNITINSGEVGIDPALGRFKFSTGKTGTVTVVGKYTGSGESYCGVYTNGNYAYLGEGSKGMYSLDISNPLSPKRVGKYELSGTINGLVGDGKFVYLINYQSDFQATSVRIIDVGSPTTPTVVGNFGISSRVYDIYPLGNYVFVAHITGLRIVDVSDPKKPVDKGIYEQATRNTVYGVYVRGNYAYLAHATTGLKILNVSDPSNIKEAGYVQLTSAKAGAQACAVYVSGNYAYLSYGAGGLQIIDVSNPEAPILVGKYNADMLDESMYRTIVRGNYAYTVSYKKDSTLFNVFVLRVIDISNPKLPKLIQKYIENSGKPIADSYDISINKGLAFVTDGSNAMRALEIPMPPELPVGSVTVDYNFTPGTLSVILTFPNGSETLSGSASNNVTWNINGGVSPYKVSLYYSMDKGKTFDNTIITDSTLSFYPWVVPGTNTLDLRVKAVVTDSNSATAHDMSDGDVRIDCIMPTVTGANIKDGERDIAVDKPLIISFSKPMNQTAVQQAFSISPDISGKVFGWNEDKTQLTITNDGFNENATYACTISTDARDNSLPGNKLTVAYRFSFKTIVPPPGFISVAANVKDAQVYLDGIFVGTGSLTINDVMVGSHTLSIQKVNYYPFTSTVSVQTKQTTNIYATLTPSVKTTLLLDAPGEVGVGETFTVTIRVEGVVGLTNMDLFLSFDPELFESIGIKDTAFIQKIASRIDTGAISYAAGVMSGSITGNGTITEFIFMAKKKGNATLSFDFNQNANRKTKLVSVARDIPFIATDQKNVSIVEFGRVDGFVAIDIPRVGSYSGIYIDVPDTKLTTTANLAGYFLLKRIPPGKTNIRANGPGLTPNIWKGIEVIGQQQVTISGTLTLINGDADGDAMVNTIDFGRLREAYFKTKTDAGWLDTGALNRNGYINADFDGDNKVNTIDFAILRDNYFKAVGQQTVQLAPMLAVGTGLVSVQSAHLFLELPQNMDKIKVNTEFPVNIKIEGVSSLTSMDFFLGFDPTVLAVNRTKGDDAFLPKIASDIKNTAGFVSHAAGLMTGSANGNGTIATVYFTLRKRQNTKLEFLQNTAKNQETMMMSTGRKVMSFTTEPMMLVFDGTKTITIGTTSTTVVGTSATVVKTGNGTIGTSATAVGTGTVIVSSMTLIASFKPDGMSYGIFLKNNYAYMSCDTAGLQIMDVSQPASPVFAGKYNTASSCRDTVVVDNYAYTAAGTKGLMVIDVSNVNKPTLVSSLAIDGFCYDIAISGNYAYVAAGATGLQIVDISKPQTPKKIGKYNTDGISRGVCVRDGYAFVADDGSGLVVIDVSNPYGPKLVGQYDTPGSAYDIWLSGKYAYIADYSGGLQIIDISNPAKPVKTGSYKTNGFAWDVMVRDNVAFVVCEAAGLFVLDVFNPTQPVLLSSYKTGGKAFGVAMQGDYVFVADDYQGLKVLAGVRGNVIPAKAGIQDNGSTTGTTVATPMDTDKIQTGGIPKQGTASNGKQTDMGMIIIDDNNNNGSDGAIVGGIPILPIDDGVISPIEEYGQWLLPITASVGGQLASIQLGADSYGSTDGFDQWNDLPLPPPPSQGNYIQIYLPHPEWGLVFGKFMQDMRQMYGNNQYLFEVQTNMPAGTEITLTMENIVGNTKGYEIMLTDTESGQIWNLSVGTELASVKSRGLVPVRSLAPVVFKSDSDGLRQFSLSVKPPIISQRFSSGWHMVSMPVKSSVFGMMGYDKANYIYEYNRAGYTQVYSKLGLGKGYWLGLLDDATINLDLPEGAISSSSEFTIPLQTGWNMIGCPFDFTPDWSKVAVQKDGVRKGLKEAVASGWVMDVLYGFVDGNYQLANRLEPWQGYWFAALGDCQLIVPNIPVINTTTNSLQLSPVVASVDTWQVGLHITAGGYEDKANYCPRFGISRDSSIGLDMNDRPEPPEPQGKFVSLYFTHPEEDIFDRFDWDMRQVGDGVIAWDAAIRTNLSGDVNISWDKEQLPAGYGLSLKDMETSLSMDMRAGTGCTYHSSAIDNGSNIRHFQIIAKADGIAKKSSIPGFSDLKIYPNPTTLSHMRFDFSGKATIKIFTLSGELVQTLTDVDGTKATEAKWDLTNSDGQSVASGVYLYMISNTQGKRYGKLAVIR